MKKYLALLLFALITSAAFGQRNYQDVVYLKNGGITEQVINELIMIETVDRSAFVYQVDEIEKSTKEPTQEKSDVSFSNSGLQPGKKAIVELGYQMGMSDHGMDQVKLNVISGYQINPYFSLGIGVGLRYYFDEKAVLIPVFADFRVNFIDNKISPYLSLGIGYSFDTKADFEGEGFLLNPTVGVTFMISEKSALNLGFGYETQRMKFRYYPNGYSDTENSGAISINVGISS